MSILQEIKDIRSGPKDLRKFGLTFAVVGAVLGSWLLYKHRPAAPYFLGGGGVFLLLGLLVPVMLKPLQIAWMTLAVRFRSHSAGRFPKGSSCFSMARSMGATFP